MIIRAFRITQRRYSLNVFSGEGARISGGRWNSAGVPAIYCAATISLAMLEILVNLQDLSIMMEGYLWTEAQFDDSLVTTIQASDLPSGWNSPNDRRITSQVGDQWLLAQTSAVLCVPSVPLHEELNYILNPAHRDFHRIQFGAPHLLTMDPRLFRGSPA